MKACKSVENVNTLGKRKTSMENDKSQWALGTVRAGQGPEGPGRARKGRAGPGRAGKAWQGRAGPARAEGEVTNPRRARQSPDPQVRDVILAKTLPRGL